MMNEFGSMTSTLNLYSFLS